MSFNWSWPKATGLAVVQAAAHTLLPLLVGHDLLHLDWLATAGLAGGSAATALLAAVIAYALPAGPATAAVSAAVGAAQDAVTASAFRVADAGEARGKQTLA
jgi:uncharacterized transporter YbjL